MWAKYHYEDLYEFSCDAGSWGYDAIEANAFVKSVEMLERLAAGPLPLSSLHNPIPNLESSYGMRARDRKQSGLRGKLLHTPLGLAHAPSSYTWDTYPLADRCSANCTACGIQA